MDLCLEASQKSRFPRKTQVVLKYFELSRGIPPAPPKIQKILDFQGFFCFLENSLDELLGHATSPHSQRHSVSEFEVNLTSFNVEICAARATCAGTAITFPLTPG